MFSMLEEGVTSCGGENKIMDVKKMSLSSFIAVVVFGAMLSPTAAAVNDAEQIRATRAVQVKDNRIAAIWEPVSQEEGESERTCTAGYLGDNIWLTAHHCVDGVDLVDGGYLRQFDGEQARISDVYTKTPEDDIALLKLEEGIGADAFSLPGRSLEKGEQATLTGFGATNEFSSSATVEVSNVVDELKFERSTYRGLIESFSVTDSRSCSGDSGSPVYIENVLYAVHTAGGFNPSCVPGKKKKMWHTDLFSRVEWVRDVMRGAAAKR